MRKKTSMSLDEMVMRELEEIARQRRQRGIKTNKSRIMEEAWRKSRQYL